MKPQDIVFVIIFIFLFIIKKQKPFIVAGLSCFIFSIPLFYKWIFFTAERLTWYGAWFIFTGTLLIPVLAFRKSAFMQLGKRKQI